MVTTQELADQELHLYSLVSDLYSRPQTPATDQRLEQVAVVYKKVHQAYADLAETDIEALKRGLFIQWYALVEPGYLTGIGNIDKPSGEKIIRTLIQRLKTGSTDSELNWMVTYYLNWGFAFEIYTHFSEFNQIVMNRSKTSFPELIDREAMKHRGQMGIYWNSIDQFRIDQ